MKNIVNLKENEISFVVNQKIYPKDVIFKACYVFVDRVYVYLDSLKKNEITATFKCKKKLTKKNLENLKGDFLNELLNALVRKNVSKRNQKVIEYIVGGAITASLETTEDQSKTEEVDEDMLKIEKEIEALKKELELEDDDYQEDPEASKKHEKG